jgi:hypothetical protein
MNLHGPEVSLAIRRKRAQMCGAASRKAGFYNFDPKSSRTNRALLLALARFPEEKWASSV